MTDEPTVYRVTFIETPRTFRMAWRVWKFSVRAALRELWDAVKNWPRTYMKQEIYRPGDPGYEDATHNVGITMMEDVFQIAVDPDIEQPAGEDDDRDDSSS